MDFEKNDYVIHIYKGKLLLNGGQYHVDSPSEGVWGIFQSKLHPFEFVESMMWDKRFILLIGVIYLDFSVSGVGVQLGKTFQLAENVDSFFLSGDLVYISYGLCNDPSVVDEKSYGNFLLSGKNYWIVPLILSQF